MSSRGLDLSTSKTANKYCEAIFKFDGFYPFSVIKTEMLPKRYLPEKPIPSYRMKISVENYNKNRLEKKEQTKKYRYGQRFVLIDYVY